VAISVNERDFRKSLYTGKLLGHLVTLKYGTESQPVIARDVQFDPVTDRPLHFDLMRVDETQTIKIEVPVHFINQEASPGLKRGGTLGVMLHTVLVACHADSIPEELVVDLTGLEIGGAVRISDLKLPAKVDAAMDAEIVVASITMSRAGVGDAAAEGGEA
jgi:large subunit ribosomal protein L25